MYVLTIIYALPLKFVCRLAKSQLFQLKIDQYFSLHVTNWFDHSKHAGRFRKCWFGYCDNTTHGVWVRDSARTHMYLHFERRILFDICESVSLINGISTTIFRSRRLHDNTTFLCEFHRFFFCKHLESMVGIFMRKNVPSNISMIILFRFFGGIGQ